MRATVKTEERKPIFLPVGTQALHALVARTYLADAYSQGELEKLAWSVGAPRCGVVIAYQQKRIRSVRLEGSYLSVVRRECKALRRS